MRIDEGTSEGCSWELRRNGSFNEAMDVGLIAGSRSFNI